MAIRTVVTRGFGNGTFDGTITLVARRGYLASSIAGNRVFSVDRGCTFCAALLPGATFTAPDKGATFFPVDRGATSQ